MQISDIVSPTYSVNSNAFKLNSSSAAASTPGCDPQARHVEFQEFTDHNFHLPTRANIKKRLTIDIDQINDFQQQNVQKVEVEEIAEVSSNEEDMRVSHLKNQRVGENELYLHEKVKSLTIKVKELERGQQEMTKENERINHLLQKKEEALEMKQRLVEDLTLKLAEVESQTIQDKFYDEKLREKQSKYRQLQKVHEKVVAMNKIMQRDLRQSQKKIMELQKEIQKSVCATQYENMLKVKESSLRLKESSLKVFNPTLKEGKENTFTNTVKSLDKKKPVTQPKKSSRIISSTINFAKKLQMKGSVI